MKSFARFILLISISLARLHSKVPISSLLLYLVKSSSESDVLTGGDKTSTFEVNGVKVGVGICYDMRFAELALKYRSVVLMPFD